MPARHDEQIELPLRRARDGSRRGGTRKNAGRKRVAARASVQHARRPLHARRHPVHVTLRVRREVGFLRKERVLREVVATLRRSCEHFRVLHFSVQSDHLHLLVEAEDAPWLARKMNGLTTWLARRVNRVLGRRGRFFADRYHRRDLTTPSEVRSALLYILQNRKKHEYARTGEVLDGVDVYSSAPWLTVGWSPEALGFLERASIALARIASLPRRHAPVTPPETWLAKTGWLRARAGRLRLDEMPSPAR